jgi:pyruvate dehydrogenase E2 component (dihydrolipoamide acetyltransferase)
MIMAFEVVMPKWGLTMKEGRIVQWLKSEGERIAKDEPLLEVETEKAVGVVESPAGGILSKIFYPAEATVDVSMVIALIDEPGEKSA